MFATIGVVADQPPQLRSVKKKKHIGAAPTPRGHTVEACSSTSLPTVEALSSPSLPTVEACGSSPSLQHVLDEFPSMLNTSKVLPRPTHRVEHFLVTKGCPVTAKYRRLDNIRLEAVKKEFAELEKQGIIRRSSSIWASALHVYVDDVLIGSKSQEEHVQHLREVLSRMAEHGIVLNGEKCVLGVSEVQFLEHMVSAHHPSSREGGRHMCFPAARDNWAADVLPGDGKFL